MNNYLIGIFIAGLVGGTIYKYHEIIKINYFKYQTNILAKKITINYFSKLIKENKDITLEEAILKFENANNFDNLEDFAKLKSRTVDNYIEAYKNLFMKAKKKYQ